MKRGNCLCKNPQDLFEEWKNGKILKEEEE